MNDTQLTLAPYSVIQPAPERPWTTRDPHPIDRSPAAYLAP